MDEFHDILSSFEGGVRLAVKAKPGAKGARAPRVVELAEGKRAVEIAVAARAEDGKANKELIGFLAGVMGLKKGDFGIKTGASGRLKVVEIQGDPALLRARAAAWLGGVERAFMHR